MARRILYLLIEETDRELKSRALIAALAVDRGFDVVLAPQWTVWQNWSDLPPGLMLFKGNNSAQAVRMIEAKRHGHMVASIEEEALGIRDQRQLLRCYDGRVDAACDIFLANGQSQAEAIIERFPRTAGRVHVTGNPRIDLLKEEFLADVREEAAALRRKYGDFVLFNTNFSTINPRDYDALGCFDDCERVGLIDSKNPRDLDDFFTWCAWEQTNLTAIGGLIDDVRRRSPWPLIIRPHPTEELSTWNDTLDGLEGVRVIREGDHLAWTAAARLLVHPGCTTGVEALLLNTPSISLVVDDNPWHDLYLSNLVNPVVASTREAAAAILRFAYGHDEISPRRADCLQKLDAHIATHPDTLATTEIVDVLAGLRCPDVDDLDIARLGKPRPVATTEGKIDLETFTPGHIGGLIATFGSKLGLREPVKVTEPAPQILHCAGRDPHRVGV